MRRSLAAALVALSMAGSVLPCLDPRVRAPDRGRPARRRRRPALARADRRPRRAALTAEPAGRRTTGDAPAADEAPPWRCATCSSRCRDSTPTERGRRRGSSPGPPTAAATRTATATRSAPSELPRPDLHPLGRPHRGRPAQPAVGHQATSRVMKKVWAEEVGRLGYRAPVTDRTPRRQREVRRLPQGRRLARASTATACPERRKPGPQVGGLGLLRPRRRLRRSAVRRPARARACGSPRRTSSSTPSSSPTTTPRTAG